MNKKGNFYVLLLFFAGMFLILFVGVLMAFGSAIINWTMDEAIPELTNMGQVGDANMTQIAAQTVVPVNTVIQQFTWITGVLFIMMLVAIGGMVFAFKMSPSKWLIGFFFVLAIMLIFGSIFVSNIYEEFYTGTDDIATRLQEHTILSNAIIYAPAIFTVLTFLVGIILFSGIQEDFV